MNINDLETKLNNIQTNLNTETNKLNNLLKQLSEKNFDNPIDKINIKKQYYNSLNDHDKLYQHKNDTYKKLISNYSQAYLDICDFYVGPELPKETFIDSKHDINSLYFLFIMSLFMK
jgi:hypothetical protein